MRRAGAQLIALLAAFVGIVAVSALWIVNLRGGPPLEGFTGGPMVVIMPLASIAIAVAWLLVRAMLPERMKASLAAVVVGTLVFGYVATAVLCGPIACFVPGPNRLLGWFVVGGAILAVLLYHLVLRAFERRS